MGTLRHTDQSLRGLWSRQQLQFRFQDLAIWFIAICLALAAVYQTAPHPGWFCNLWNHARGIWRMENDATRYSMASALLYVWVTLLAMWLVYGKANRLLRLAAVGILAIASAYTFELWFRRIAEHPPLGQFASIWFQTLSETAMALVALIVLTGSLSLVGVFAHYLRAGLR